MKQKIEDRLLKKWINGFMTRDGDFVTVLFPLDAERVYSSLEERVLWIEENCDGDWGWDWTSLQSHSDYYPNAAKFWFENLEDAALFRLRF